MSWWWWWSVVMVTERVSNDGPGTDEGRMVFELGRGRMLLVGGTIVFACIPTTPRDYAAMPTRAD